MQKVASERPLIALFLRRTPQNPSKMVKKSPKNKNKNFLPQFRRKSAYQLSFYSLNRRQVRICTRTLPSALKYAVKHCVKNHFIFFTIKKR